MDCGYADGAIRVIFNPHEEQRDFVLKGWRTWEAFGLWVEDRIQAFFDAVPSVHSICVADGLVALCAYSHVAGVVGWLNDLED